MIRTCLKGVAFGFLMALVFSVTCTYATPVLRIMVPKGGQVAGDPNSTAGATLTFGIVKIDGKFTFERKNSSTIKVMTGGSLFLTFRCECPNKRNGCNLIVSGKTMACAAAGCDSKCDLKLFTNVPVKLEVKNP